MSLTALHNATGVCGKTEQQSTEAADAVERSETASWQLPGATCEGFAIYAAYYIADHCR